MDGEIEPDAVGELLDDDGVRVVDIRSAAAFRRGHIPGSENVPFDRLTGEAEQFAGAERVVTVCPHGKASVQAARLLGSYEGLSDAVVESMAGGLEAWEGELATEAEEGEPDEGPEAPF